MYLEPDTVVAVIFLWLMTLVTTLGNLTILIIILRKKKLRNRPDTRFLLSLASADLAVGIFVMPPAVIRIMVSLIRTEMHALVHKFSPNYFFKKVNH